MKRLIVILLLILPTLLFSQQLTNDEINWLKQGQKELIEIIKLNSKYGEIKMNSGIYKITSPSGKIYIGQSVNINKRFGMYKRYDCVGQTKLYNSFKKYGVQNHKFEVIHYSENDLNNLEIYYIDLFKSTGDNGLNLRSGGDSYRYSDESKLKMRNAKLGKKRPQHSEETKRKIKETCLKRDWSYMTEELKKRMSDDQKGRTVPREWIDKMLETKKKNKLKQLEIMVEKKKNLVEAMPMWNYMFLTCDRKPDKTESGIIISTNAGRGAQIEMKQDVIKCGDGVRTLKPGYSVEIDPRPYFVKDWVDQNNPTINEELHKKTVGIAWPIEKIDGVELMVVPDNHIRMYWKNGLD